MEVSTDNMNKLKRALRENTMPLLTDEDLQRRNHEVGEYNHASQWHEYS